WVSVRRVAVPGPLDAASCIWASVTVITTWLELIGWPLLKLEAETLAMLGSGRTWVTKTVPSAKSESVDCGLVEERVSAMKLAKRELRHSAVRFTPTSRNSPVSGCVEPFLLT